MMIAGLLLLFVAFVVLVIGVQWVVGFIRAAWGGRFARRIP